MGKDEGMGMDSEPRVRAHVPAVGLVWLGG
jgi:hypothetical protein